MRGSLGALQSSRGGGGLPEPEAEHLGGLHLEASRILFASEECSDRARSFRKGRAERRLLHAGHAQLDAVRRSGAGDSSWRLAGSSCVGAKP